MLSVRPVSFKAQPQLQPSNQIPAASSKRGPPSLCLLCYKKWDSTPRHAIRCDYRNYDAGRKELKKLGTRNREKFNSAVSNMRGSLFFSMTELQQHDSYSPFEVAELLRSFGHCAVPEEFDRQYVRIPVTNTLTERNFYIEVIEEQLGRFERNRRQEEQNIEARSLSERRAAVTVEQLPSLDEEPIGKEEEAFRQFDIEQFASDIRPRASTSLSKSRKRGIIDSDDDTDEEPRPDCSKLIQSRKDIRGKTPRTEGNRDAGEIVLMDVEESLSSPTISCRNMDKTRIHKQTETKTVTQTVTKEGNQTETVTQTVVNTGNHTETKTETQTVTKAGNQTETKTMTNTANQSETKIQTQTVTTIGNQTVTETVTKTETYITDLDDQMAGPIQHGSGETAIKQRQQRFNSRKKSHTQTQTKSPPLEETNVTPMADIEKAHVIADWIQDETGDFVHANVDTKKIGRKFHFHDIFQKNEIVRKVRYIQDLEREQFLARLFLRKLANRQHCEIDDLNPDDIFPVSKEDVNAYMISKKDKCGSGWGNVSHTRILKIMESILNGSG